MNAPYPWFKDGGWLHDGNGDQLAIPEVCSFLIGFSNAGGNAQRLMMSCGVRKEAMPFLLRKSVVRSEKTGMKVCQYSICAADTGEHIPFDKIQLMAEKLTAILSSTQANKSAAE